PAAGAVTARAPGAAAVGRAAVGALAAKGRPLMAVSAGAAREVAAAEVVAGKAREFAASPGRVACGAISSGPVVLGTVTGGVAVVALPRRLLLVVVAPALAHLARAALVVVSLQLLGLALAPDALAARADVGSITLCHFRSPRCVPRRPARSREGNGRPVPRLPRLTRRGGAWAQGGRGALSN